MLVKIPSSNVFDEMPARGIASKIINRWPIAILGIILAVTVAWIGFLVWLVLLLSGHAP
jgi:hypothetical protein